MSPTGAQSLYPERFQSGRQFANHLVEAFEFDPFDHIKCGRGS